MLLFDLYVHACQGHFAAVFSSNTLGGPGSVARASAKPLVGTSLGEVWVPYLLLEPDNASLKVPPKGILRKESYKASNNRSFVKFLWGAIHLLNKLTLEAACNVSTVPCEYRKCTQVTLCARQPRSGRGKAPANGAENASEATQLLNFP